MTRKMLLTFVFVFMMAMLIISVYFVFASEKIVKQSKSPISTPMLLISPTPIPTPIVNITVTSPEIGTEVKSPLKVAGQVRTLESPIYLRLKDQKGKIIAESTASAQSLSGGESQQFLGEIKFNKPKTVDGFLEVSQISTQDKKEINKVIIPVTFLDPEVKN